MFDLNEQIQFGEKFIIDPTRDEEKVGKVKVEIISKKNTKKLPFMNVQGVITLDDVEKVKIIFRYVSF